LIECLISGEIFVIFRLLTITVILIVWFLVLIRAQTEKTYELDLSNGNYSIECEINGEYLNTFVRFSAI
jgi:hypothetical protein